MINVFGPMPVAYGQDFLLPKPGAIVHLSPEFNPPILKGIKVHADNPFQFDFILDTGDSSLSSPNALVGDPEDSGQSLGSRQKHSGTTEEMKQESTKLIKYFLASLTIPEKDMWVNLSPYEKDRIIPQGFGQTEMGRDLLAEDYMLKQITASLIYPEDEVGRKFWKRVYEEAQKKYGTTNIPVNTFNKVWIVPEKAVVFENAKAGTAYVLESRLKVMLEQDYVALNKNNEGRTSPKAISTEKDVHTLASQIVREIVIPELTREVNENKNFVKLRQVYNSLILAAWYKKKIKDSILSKVYADKNKVEGVQYTSSVVPERFSRAPSSLANPGSPTEAFGDDKRDDTEAIYRRYIQAFKKGVYNYIKEDVDPQTQERIPRKYFSGGFDFAQMTRLGDIPTMEIIKDPDNAMLVALLTGVLNSLFQVGAQLEFGKTNPRSQPSLENSTLLARISEEKLPKSTNRQEILGFLDTISNEITVSKDLRPFKKNSNDNNGGFGEVNTDQLRLGRFQKRSKFADLDEFKDRLAGIDDELRGMLRFINTSDEKLLKRYEKKQKALLEERQKIYEILNNPEAYNVAMNNALIRELLVILSGKDLGEKGRIPKGITIGVYENGVIWVELEGIKNGVDLTRDSFAKLEISAQIKALVEIAETVDALHKKGILHNDLKPANIIINEQGEVMLIDFGIALRIGGESHSGTLGYMPAEIIRTVASDIYSYGKVINDLLFPDFGGLIGAKESEESGLKKLIAWTTQKSMFDRRPEDKKGKVDMQDLISELKSAQSYFKEKEDGLKELREAVQSYKRGRVPSFAKGSSIGDPFSRVKNNGVKKQELINSNEGNLLKAFRKEVAKDKAMLTAGDSLVQQVIPNAIAISMLNPTSMSMSDANKKLGLFSNGSSKESAPRELLLERIPVEMFPKSLDLEEIFKFLNNYLDGRIKIDMKIRDPEMIKGDKKGGQGIISFDPNEPDSFEKTAKFVGENDFERLKEELKSVEEELKSVEEKLDVLIKSSGATNNKVEIDTVKDERKRLRNKKSGLAYMINEPLKYNMLLNNSILTEVLALLDAQRKLGNLDVPRSVSIGVYSNGAIWVKFKGVKNAEDLTTYISKNTNLVGLVKVIGALKKVAETLKSLHGIGMLHNDLKPGNIVVAEGVEQLRAMLIDFGVAIPRDRFSVSGTVPFRPSELLRDIASDIYSYGITMQVALSHYIENNIITREDLRASGLNEVFIWSTKKKEEERKPEGKTGPVDIQYFIDGLKKAEEHFQSKVRGDKTFETMKERVRAGIDGEKPTSILSPTFKSKTEGVNNEFKNEFKNAPLNIDKADKDKAMLNNGGIDFNSDKMNLETRNQGGEIKFHLDPAQLAQLQNAPGFTPVIINIQPMTDLRLFLGINQPTPSPVAV
ncbi:MAG: protein kinase [Candidatus Omnitrophica bacterium]|nr:protein kinase [Candidatus Omnitrophota bacterium]